MKVYIGYDEREHAAAAVAMRSLRRVTHPDPIVPELLRLPQLRDRGLMWRTVDQRGGSDHDLVSNEPFSTRFKISRFLTPILCQSGFALFVDCDVVFLRDPREMAPWLFNSPSPSRAVCVVQHDLHAIDSDWKMVNQRQRPYPRKNWSSVMLFNCDHPANRRLSLRDVNERPAADLHAFYWLHDDEIGALDPCWNWLVDVQPRPENLGIAHMTLGGPWLQGWKGGSFDEEWKKAAGL